MKGDVIVYASERPNERASDVVFWAVTGDFGGIEVMTKPAGATPPPDAAARRRAPPILAYSVEHVPSFDAAFYNGARGDVSKVAEFTVPPRAAKAFEVPAGYFFRIVSVEGPQRRGLCTRHI